MDTPPSFYYFIEKRRSTSHEVLLRFLCNRKLRRNRLESKPSPRSSESVAKDLAAVKASTYNRSGSPVAVVCRFARKYKFASKLALEATPLAKTIAPIVLASLTHHRTHFVYSQRWHSISMTIARLIYPVSKCIRYA